MTADRNRRRVPGPAEFLDWLCQYRLLCHLFFFCTVTVPIVLALVRFVQWLNGEPVRLWDV